MFVNITVGVVLRQKNNGKWHYNIIYLQWGISNKKRIHSLSIAYKKLKDVIDN